MSEYLQEGAEDWQYETGQIEDEPEEEEYFDCGWSPGNIHEYPIRRAV